MYDQHITLPALPPQMLPPPLPLLQRLLLLLLPPPLFTSDCRWEGGRAGPGSGLSLPLSTKYKAELLTVTDQPQGRATTACVWLVDEGLTHPQCVHVCYLFVGRGLVWVGPLCEKSQEQEQAGEEQRSTDSDWKPLRQTHRSTLKHHQRPGVINDQRGAHSSG